MRPAMSVGVPLLVAPMVLPSQTFYAGNLRLAINGKDKSIDRPHDVNRVGAGEIAASTICGPAVAKLNLAADQRLDRLVGRNMGEIDVDAVLFEEASLLGHPQDKSDRWR